MPLESEEPPKKFTLIVTPPIEEHKSIAETEAKALLESVEDIKYLKSSLKNLLSKHRKNLNAALMLKNEEAIKLHTVVLMGFVNDHHLLEAVNSTNSKLRKKKSSLLTRSSH